MPFYDYKCTECGKIDEKMLNISQLDDQQYCTKCGAKSKRKFHALPVVHEGYVKGLGVTRDVKEAEDYMFDRIVETHESGD